MLEKIGGCPSFFIFSGIAGGTGSGLGSRLLIELKDEIAMGEFHCFTVFPLIKGETPMQHYNCGFSLRYMNEIASTIVGPYEQMYVSNQWFVDAPLATLGVKPTSVSFESINASIAKSMSRLFTHEYSV